MNYKIKIIVSWCLVIMWMGIIFNFSNMDTNESNAKSKDTIEKVVDTTIDTSNKIGMIKEDVNDDKKREITNKLNKPLRKCMHASVYFILSILLLHALLVSHHKFNKKYILTMILTFFLCSFYAVTDEYHQTFVLGRTGQFNDVLIDSVGAILGVVMYYFVVKRKDNNYLNSIL